MIGLKSTSATISVDVSKLIPFENGSSPPRFFGANKLDVSRVGFWARSWGKSVAFENLRIRNKHGGLHEKPGKFSNLQ